MSDETPPPAPPSASLSQSDELPPASTDAPPVKETDPHHPVTAKTGSDPAPQPPAAETETEAAPPASAATATTREELSEVKPPLTRPHPPVEEKENEKETPAEEKEAKREIPLAAAKEEESIVESEKGKSVSGSSKTFIQPAVSFKEESNLVIDLSDSELKSLNELRKLIQESINSQTLLPELNKSSPSTSTPQPLDSKSTTIESALKQDQSTPTGSPNPEITIWGIPLLKDDRTDVILLKFLRARDFKVNDSFQMIKTTLKWRQEFGIDKLVDENLGDDLEKVVFMHGHDREGHPVCYNVYGEFQNKELYSKTFGDQARREKFLRWRIQFLERSIRKLDFTPGGVNTIFHINDLKGAPGPGKRELRQATRQALHLLQDNYPEFVAKQVFINVPWWYIAFYTMMSPFMTQRTKSKFVFAGVSKTADTLFKYISPEQVPIQYGGLSVDYCDCNPDFTFDDPVTDINIKPTTKQFVEILCSEKCVIVWELRVVGWEVTCSAEYVPNDKDAYTVIIQKASKLGPHDEPVISGSFAVRELGKIILTVDNPTFKRRKLLYRYKVLPFFDEK